MLKTISESVFSLVFPVSCELCGEILSPHASQGVCRSCQSQIAPIAPPWCAGCGRSVLKDGERCGYCRNEHFHFDRAFACAYYDDKMKKLIHAFKFERRRALLAYFSGLLEEFAQKHLSATPFDLLVPVPMHGAHERERGFNQARLLSAALAKRSGKAHAPGALGCRNDGARQSSLTKTKRRENAAGRFFVKKAAGICSAHALLIDDILTTGQTASACAKALKEAGAQTVTVLALARGI